MIKGSQVNAYTAIGDSHIAMDAYNGVIGILKPMDDQIYDINIELLTGAVKRVRGGVVNEPSKYHESAGSKLTKITIR